MKYTGKLLFGLLLFAGLLFLTVSLASWSPSDSSGNGLFPAASVPQNRLGATGAALASLCFNFFGWAAWLVPLFAMVSFIFFWTRDGVQQPGLKTVGFFLILCGVCGALPLLTPESSPGILAGPGGRLGAMLQYLFSGWLAPLGQFIFLVSLVAAGIILAFDSFLLRLSLWMTGIGVISEIVATSFRRRNREPETTGEEATTDDEFKEFGPASHQKRQVTRLDAARAFRGPLPGRDRQDKRAATENGAERQGADHKDEDASDEDGDPDFQEDADFSDSRDDDLDNDEQVLSSYDLPDMELLMPAEVREEHPEDDLVRRSRLLEKAFDYFNLSIKVLGTQTGPVLTLFEVALAPGTRISQIRNLEDDLAIIMKATRVRVVAPLPGKNTIGIEIPNAHRQLVRLRELMEVGDDKVSKLQLPIFLGRDVVGEPMIVDLTKMPHLLIAGQTGTGKSVCLNAIIMSMLMTRTPDQVRFILIDPKMVELNSYSAIPHLMHPVVIDMKKAEAILAWAVNKMEERYAVLARIGVRQLSEYNALSTAALKRRAKPVSDADWDSIPRKMPHIVVIVDEMADLVMTSGKEVESLITRLAQKSRAVGIHLVLATQKPTVDVITGLIKSNLPARIAFGVSTRTDSMVVLDCKGAEQLLGHGDMLFLQPGTSQVVRGQGTFVANEEIEAVLAEIGTEKTSYEINEEDLAVSSDELGDIRAALTQQKDKLYAICVEDVCQQGSASTSYLQRKFNIGYGRAARIIDCMTADGIITPPNPHKPSQPRDILISFAQWQEQQSNISAPAATPTERSADIVPFKKENESLLEINDVDRNKRKQPDRVPVKNFSSPMQNSEFQSHENDIADAPDFVENPTNDLDDEYDESALRDDDEAETEDSSRDPDEYEEDEFEEDEEDEYDDEYEEDQEDEEEQARQTGSGKRRKGFTDEDWDNYLKSWDE
ncbi:MAG: DNA translocase FtsK [Planctomycetia bacterium]|nr:DNA translocase FtsK [Planctomycetia bacterium]